MPSNPTVSDVHVNSSLTNISIAFAQDPANSIFRRLWPTVPVPNKSDSYFVWDRGDFNRDDARETAAGDEYPVGVKRLSTDSYNAKVYKYSEMISDEEIGNSDSALALDRTTVENVTRKQMIRMDRQLASIAFKTGVWTGSTTQTDITPAVKWDAGATSTPISDIKTQIRHMSKKGVSRAGMKLLCPPDVFDALVDNDEFLARYENVMAAVLTEELIARVLGIGEVIVGESVFNSAKEGAATVDSFILDTDSALLTYSPSSATLNVPSAGYNMVWTGLTGGAGGVDIEKIRRAERDADQIKSRSAFDVKIVAPKLGVFFTDVLA